MKCEGCNDSRIMFSTIPDICDNIYWASHAIREVNGKCKLYHYQCSGCDLATIYELFFDMANDNKS